MILQLLRNNMHIIHSTTRTDVVVPPVAEEEQAIAKGGVACPFPWRLHTMLHAAKQEGLEHIVSWQPHGRAFMVRNPSEFVERILPRFFSQTKYPSFQRQLNLYGFSRFAHGRDKGAYYHPCFIRGKPSLVRGMIRRKIKGTKVRRTMHPSEEPDFYDPEWNNNNNNTAAVVVAAAAQDNDVEPPCTHPSSQLEQHKKEILQQQQQQQRPVVVTKVAPTVIDEDRKVAAPKVARKKTTETTATTKKNKTSTRQDSPSTTILPVDMILDDDFKIPDIADTFDRMDRSLLSDNDDVNGLPVSDFDFLGFLDNDDDVREDNNDPLLVWDMNFTPKPTMFAI